jgi:type II secretory pathway pseudopilin PulG
MVFFFNFIKLMSNFQFPISNYEDKAISCGIISVDDKQRGELLFELLIALSIAAIVLTLGGQLVSLGLRASKVANNRGVGTGLFEEMFAAVDGVAGEKWINLYGLTKNSDYHPTISSGSWVFTAGSEVVTIDGIDYTRSFKVQNVCRNGSGVITGLTDSSGTAVGGSGCSGSGGNFDPSTEFVTFQVSWPNYPALVVNRYITRWRNKVCTQTSWGSTGSGVNSCPDTKYETKTNLNSGASLEICSGGC